MRTKIAAGVASLVTGLVLVYLGAVLENGHVQTNGHARAFWDAVAAMSLSLDHWRLVVSVVGATFAAAGFLQLWFVARALHRGARAAANEGRQPHAVGSPSPVTDWLLGIAEGDRQQMEHRIAVVRAEMRCTGLSALEPYVDLYFTLLNCSVFLLTLDRIEGHAAYGGEGLRHVPEIIDRQTAAPHGEYLHLELRQWLSPQTAERMQSARRDGPVSLGIGNLAVWLLCDDPAAASPRPVRSSLGNTVTC